MCVITQACGTENAWYILEQFMLQYLPSHHNTWHIDHDIKLSVMVFIPKISLLEKQESALSNGHVYLVIIDAT